MKALLITTSYPDHPGSQRGIFIRKLCLELKKNGIEVMVLTPRVLKTSPFHEDDCGIAIRRFWYPSGDVQLNQLTSIPLMPMAIYMISGIIMALRTFMAFRPDVIHGNWIVPTGLIASLTGFLTGTPVINTARGMDTRVRENRVVRAFFGLALRLSDRLTVVSDSMRSIEGLNDAEVISSGVDPAFFDIVPDYSSRTVLYSRSLEPIYDATTLIKSIPIVSKRIPGVRFVIAGSGSQEGQLKTLARDLKIDDKVNFLGHIPHEEVVELTKRSSVFVSTALADGTSIALLEAMIAGLIPVATDIEANRTLISHERDGYLFRPRDEKDLADNLIHAFSGEISPGILSQKRDLLKDTIPWSIVAKKFISGYKQVLEKPRRH